MRGWGDRVRRSRTLAAAAALFPEFADVPPAGLREGLLRAPPRGRAQPPCLSLVARDGFEQTAVPSPSGVLAERGWERPDLLARAVAARRSLVAARVGGAWWTGGETDLLPTADDIAVVAFDAGVPADALAAAM